MHSAVCSLAKEAGQAIMAIYTAKKPAEVMHKQDHSPLTEADLAANAIIMAGLSQLTPDIPILSEEALVDYAQRKNWQRYWLVDPLDGTQQFINRTGEFTVNIALIEHGVATTGVIYAPVTDVLWYAFAGQAWKEQQNKASRIYVATAEPPVLVASRSQVANNLRLKQYLADFGPHQLIDIGSSLKFCLVAEGQAQLYPRFGPTNIWDTGAGQAIVEAAGGTVTDWQGQRLDYTARSSFLNPHFRASAE
jgi:3'(2'), 5'-bisphosphate nucleotidase